jgi:D-sedoheptulose 7-phosphate isomerase
VSASRVSAGLSELADLVLASRELSPRVAALAVRYAGVLRAGRTLFFCGNGGSAADAQHLATEYVVRYSRARPGLAAIALTTDSSILTAAGNDLGFEQIFARQVEALARPGDLLVLHSTSGRSSNLLAAARAARAGSVGTAAFLGRGGGPLATEVDDAVVVASDDTSRIQLLHLALEHMIVELVEAELLPAR